MIAMFQHVSHLFLLGNPCRVRHTHHGAHGAPYIRQLHRLAAYVLVRERR